jgi:hypothetical protein
MKQQRIFALPAVALTLCVTACVNPGVVEVAPGQYMIAKRDFGGMAGNTATLKARMIEEANAFAADQGKRAMPVPLSEMPGWPSCDPLLVEYHFRVVDPTQTAAPPQSKAPGVQSLSGDLIRLDELRTRGLLTQAEFDEQKQRLLQGN